ncbi:SRPBCC family protein [Nonomuraea roseoviolacea]|uniref:Carbon monoxide dehydrogenase subunit G n=1 Tax=Nonomuraea roseoviolacea subsp. carminata TaxID=160689 RepID=A0ABT1JX30_9ACTN|nr:SRPBCC family protein [Nonomuraea roseoviolacea]MCP2346318.1 carbon monoxide dehydrogenase subunit G [Nonomuraea roseoviolacea subsp. carminata]
MGSTGGRVSHSVLTHEFRIDAAPEEVFVHLTTPESYVGLSPLVVAVRDVDRSRPGVIRYTAVERFRLLPFLTYDFLTYDNPIDVALHTDGLSVYGEVRSPGRVRMAYRFDLAPDGGGTRVRDRLDLTAPWLVAGFAAGQARKVQLARARILAERLS